MGNRKSKSKSVSPPTIQLYEHSVILPIPLYLTSPNCASTRSVTYTYNNTAFECERNSDTYTNAHFLFEPDLGYQVNDCWNLFHPQKFALNQTAEMQHTIHRISSSKNSKNTNNTKCIDWLSVFGTQIIQKGQFKQWKLRIYPRNDTINHIIQYQSFPIADIVIGVVDNETIESNNGKHNQYLGGFWTEPFFGYAFYGFNGKKFHNHYRGKVYGNKFKVGDTLTVELDLQCNQLNFYVNGEDNGMAFNIDGKRNYRLALSLCDDNYDIQICSEQNNEDI